MKKIFPLMIFIGMLIFVFMLFHGSGRASGAAKSASNDITEQNGTEQAGPPWLDEAWHYRRPVIISNSGAPLPYYQILVTLDNGNFNFNQANVSGSDIRLTHSDGTTELKYWIESWDKINHKAYIWVRVPSLASGDTTIYLYYNNPAATSLSNGEATFDGFDDNWSQYTGAGLNQEEETQTPQSPNEVESPFVWSTINGSPKASSGILSLVSGTGINSTSSYQYQAVGFRANFGSGTGHEWAGFNNVITGKGTMIGDSISDEDNLFLMNFNTTENDTLLPRIGGIDWHDTYHVYEVRWKSGWSEGNIDHGVIIKSSTVQVPSAYLPVTLYSYTGSNATLMVDWVYLRQYREPEPIAAVGTEQGLVDLGIDMVDSPDPLRPGVELTYLLTISNSSSIDAPGVVVTDTLPGSVQFVRANPSLECSHIASDVICSLNTIAANSTASISIVVNPTIGGKIINTAMVGTLGYDLDMSNNISEVETLVDSDPPQVNWEIPVVDGQNYTTNGGLVTLEASATDNDQVAWVEFWYWDHLPLNNPKGKVSIGTDNTYPYQMQFNSDILVPNEVYQVFVQAADRAGNISSIYTVPHPVIYVERILLFYLYLPAVIK